jgi:CheY-like chemotaxis protein
MNETLAILYVEDDPGSREIMELMLCQAMGLTNVTIFSDSHDFMARVHALRPIPHLILLDIHVPPHNGFEMLKMLRSDASFATVPVIALTASVMNEEVQQLHSAGFNGVIGKPIDMDTFPMIVERVLNGEEVWRVMA